MVSSTVTRSAKQEITGLLTLLASAVGLAALLVWGMVHYYGPSGQYSVKSTLLSPEVLETLSYNDATTPGAAQQRFVFDKIELLSFDENSRTWRRDKVPISEYQRLYQVIIGDWSINGDDGATEALFNFGQTTRILLQVKAANTSKSGVILDQVFQEMQFASDGDHYRIELHDANTQSTWAYFYHPGIYSEIEQINLSLP